MAVKQPPRERPSPVAKLTIKLTHVNWRDGRPRFDPGPRLRSEGWKSEDLRHGPEGRRGKIGAWFTPEEALIWIKQREIEIAARREQVEKARQQHRRIPAKGKARSSIAMCVGDMFDTWFAKNPKFTGRVVVTGQQTLKATKSNTVTFYRQKSATLERFDPLIWEAPVDALTTPIVYDLYERLWQAKGIATARAVIATLSAAISWSMKRGLVKLPANPAKGLSMEQPDPRLRCLTPAEVRQLVAAVDHLGRPEIGDAIIMGVWTGQRQNDRLALGEGGKLDGRRVFRQLKTGVVVLIPDAPELANRLEAARLRRRDWTTRPLEVVVDEKQKLAWNRWHYANTFSEVRDAAAYGIPAEGYRAERPEPKSQKKQAQAKRDADKLATLPQADPAQRDQWILRPLPSVADARDQDLRDTAVTWLARAGCTMMEIAQITGHSLQSIQQTLRHYLSSHPEIADHAIAKLVAWYERQAGQ